MTEDTARRVANVMFGVAVVGAGYYILATPPLRRLAWRLTVVGVTSLLASSRVGPAGVPGSEPRGARREAHDAADDQRRI
jgi:hypothetical protein